MRQSIVVVVLVAAVVASAAEIESRMKTPGGCRGRMSVEGADAADKSEENVQPMCCQGKNNSCVARGPRLNAPTATTCFCDSDCMNYGDCCLDYAEYCPVIDCVAEEEWGEWSECDAKCGQGLKKRRKAILVEAKNGGRRCHMNETQQVAVCMGTNCKVQRAPDALELEETGRIIPAAFATWRKDKLYSPFQDIRKNLFDHYGDPTAVDRPAYCAQFQVTDVHSTCRKMAKTSEWLTTVVKGATLCVECQSFAMQKELGGRCRGHGVLNRQTQWKAVTVPGCHGKWKLISAHTEQCDCDATSGLSFTLV